MNYLSSTLMEKILDSIHRNNKVFFIILAVFILTALFLASRTKVEQNVLRLIMREDISMGMEKILEKNPLFQSFYIDAWGADRETLTEFAGDLMNEVEKEKLADAAGFKPDGGQIEKTMKFLFNKRFYLTGLTPAAAREALSENKLGKKLALARVSLLSLTAPVEKERIARDPISLFGLVEPRLKLAAGTSSPGREGPCMFTPDDSHCLMSFHPEAHPSDFEESAELVDSVGRIIERMTAAADFAGIKTLTMGPHLFSAEGGRIVKRDVAFVFSISGVLIFLLFFLFFRRITPLLLTLTILVVAVASGVAVASLLTGRLHGITIGFASILLGISIDYVIHVLSACRSQHGRGEPFESTSRSVAGIFPSLFGGWATTTLIFLLLAVNRFPLVRQMGFVAVGGVTAAFLVSILFLPQVSRGPGKRGGRPSFLFSRLSGFLARRRTLAAALLVPPALLAVIFSVAASGLRVDSNVETLEYRSPELSRNTDEFRKRWNLMGKGDLVIARGKSFEEAARLNDAIFENMSEGQERGAVSSFMSISPLIPSIRTQKKSISAVASAEPAIRDALKKAEEKYGFNASFFLPFFEDFEKSKSGQEPCITPGSVKGTFLEGILQNAAAGEEESATIITSFIPAGDRSGILNMLPLDKKNVSWFNNRVFLTKIFETLIREVLGTLVLSVFFVLIFLLLYFRSVKMTLLAVTPLMISLPVTAGLFAVAGQPVNAIGILSFCLVIGLGIDYGIFMTNAVRGKTGADSVASAVLLSALTTLVAFGALAFCRSPVLSAVGKVVALGIVLNAFSAMIVIPAAYGVISPGKRA